MTMPDTGTGPRSPLRRFRDVVLLGAEVAGAITILSVIMRSVGEVGGSCADGGLYVSGQPCPDGTGVAMLAVLGLAVFCVVATIWGAARSRALHPVFWFWPALFLALGSNSLDDGLFDPPAGAGISGGYVSCGVLFWVMGAGRLTADGYRRAESATLREEIDR
jgi:hypothetical protein